MDPNVPGSSNVPASGGGPFKRNPDGTLPEGQDGPPEQSPPAEGEQSADTEPPPQGDAAKPKK